MSFRSTSLVTSAVCVSLAVGFAACSNKEPPAGEAPGTGGSARGGATGSGGSGRGGATGTGGSSAGGATGTGGSSAGGATGTGGGSAGGTTGTGGSAPGSGGASGGQGGGGGGGGAPADANPADTGGGDAASTPTGERFSFFVTSWEAIQGLSKSNKGFGGDLRYGTDNGVTGADKICTEIAESVVKGSGAKGWRAFLSAEKGPEGTPVNAIDRIGNGPWYDRKGRLLAMTKANLLAERPIGADPAIREDFPNEHGINNSRPVPGGPEIDNHHFLTGSDAMGRLMGTATCNSWSTLMTTPATRPRIGFSFTISNRRHWISGQTEGGCGAGVDLDGGGGSDPSNPVVGSGGGYGGIYCFALQP